MNEALLIITGLSLMFGVYQYGRCRHYLSALNESEEARTDSRILNESLKKEVNRLDGRVHLLSFVIGVSRISEEGGKAAICRILDKLKDSCKVNGLDYWIEKFKHDNDLFPNDTKNQNP